MKKERSNKLWKLYESGMTTIEEEKELAEIFKDSDDSQWFDYINHHKKNAPAGIEDSIWNKIKSEKRTRRILNFRYASVAATIILLISLFVFNPLSSSQTDENDKASVLAEAYAMIGDSDNDVESKEIIYEDENLVLYTE